MESNGILASPCTPKSDRPQFVVSVHDVNRGWTDNRPLHRRADSVRIKVEDTEVYVYLLGEQSRDEGYGPVGVRVIDGEPRHHFIPSRDTSNLVDAEADAFADADAWVHE